MMSSVLEDVAVGRRGKGKEVKDEENEKIRRVSNYRECSNG
jgi:hypothetical protein